MMDAPLGTSGVEAARRVLIEVWTILGAYGDALTLIGGATPPLLVGEVEADPYVGTLDVDVVIDPEAIAEEAYRTISELLRERGYRQDATNKYRWFRVVEIGGEDVEVELDFLAPQDGSGRRHRRIAGEPLARNADGALLVRDQYEVHHVGGRLPDGRYNKVTVRVAAPAAMVVLKALALDGRDKLKDSYDIDYILTYIAGGADAVGQALGELRQMEVVKRALEILDRKFESVDSIGPTSVAKYRRQGSGEAAEATRAVAFARVRRVIESARFPTRK